MGMVRFCLHRWWCLLMKAAGRDGLTMLKVEVSEQLAGSRCGAGWSVRWGLGKVCGGDVAPHFHLPLPPSIHVSEKERDPTFVSQAKSGQLWKSELRMYFFIHQ